MISLAKQENRTNQSLLGALAYLLGPITGVLFLILEKNNSFVRFHAMQSTILFGGLFVIYIVFTLSIVGLILIPFLLIAQFIIWILLMYKAFNGEMFQFPYVGKLAKKQLAKN